jgi:plastocyanin
LRGGEPIVLRLINGGRGGHNFSAPEFFAAAQPTGANIRRGAIEVESNRTVEVRVVPQRGSYALRCTHTLHTSFGMRGRIIVD